MRMILGVVMMSIELVRAGEVQWVFSRKKLNSGHVDGEA
jgi:hypothetical protein